jgi:DNA-binding transcriptional regulator YiaG
LPVFGLHRVAAFAPTIDSQLAPLFAEFTEPTMNALTGHSAHDGDIHERRDALAGTYAERLAVEAMAREEQRRIDRAEQSSTLNTPGARIRAWEKLHGLRLPSDAAHPVLRLVASGTGLTLAQVREEQQAISARRTPSLPSASDT